MMESEDCIQDRLLVNEAQGGSHEAFEQLVHAHDQAVLRLAIRITGSQTDAQDIYQEAFLKAYTRLESFRFECSFSSWIYRIATNVCLDHLRRNRKHKRNSSLEENNEGGEYNLVNQVPDDRAANNPEQQLFSRELRALISFALQQLTPRERMVFELRHFQGLRIGTVGEILNSSEASIKNSLFRATNKMRLQLALHKTRRDIRCGGARAPRILGV
jgi:RNA polymerase sigma-70 factor (ECF subfamily)